MPRTPDHQYYASEHIEEVSAAPKLPERLKLPPQQSADTLPTWGMKKISPNPPRPAKRSPERSIHFEQKDDNDG